MRRAVRGYCGGMWWRLSYVLKALSGLPYLHARWLNVADSVSCRDTDVRNYPSFLFQTRHSHLATLSGSFIMVGCISRLATAGNQTCDIP
ncbi:hypothetical protein BDZ45DRAFT_154413 [Acephala macrosclerotiorum]|nr:hypothetical protein BDZ45DRAFT_154413 [Acephala macrosclerotiorum]